MNVPDIATLSLQLSWRLETLVRGAACGKGIFTQTLGAWSLLRFPRVWPQPGRLGADPEDDAGIVLILTFHSMLFMCPTQSLCR